MRRHVRSFLATGAAAALLVAPAAQAALSGAIFTTNANGTFVNGNVYDSVEDVYLNGGPRANLECSAAGLPDGDYYFQVTDPAGKELLSDYGPRNGTIWVTGGMISDYDPPIDGTAHSVGQGRCPGSLTVQLWPFGPTSNPGGEYKVWLTPARSYACDTSFCSGSFGFFSSSSKTDNFKVQPPDGGTPD
jgi:hypothetical protein